MIVPWDLDTCSDACLHCSTPFSRHERRHHCRSCGTLVCDRCSPYSAYLPQLGYPADIAQRVCRPCATKSIIVIDLEMDAAAACRQTPDDVYRVGEVLRAAAEFRPQFNPYLHDVVHAHFDIAFLRHADIVVDSLVTARDNVALQQAVQCARELLHLYRSIYETSGDGLEHDLERGIRKAEERIEAAREPRRRVRFDFVPSVQPAPVAVAVMSRVTAAARIYRPVSTSCPRRLVVHEGASSTVVY